MGGGSSDLVSRSEEGKKERARKVERKDRRVRCKQEGGPKLGRNRQRKGRVLGAGSLTSAVL